VAEVLEATGTNPAQIPVDQQDCANAGEYAALISQVMLPFPKRIIILVIKSGGYFMYGSALSSGLR
jgi:hypothetical protein